MIDERTILFTMVVVPGLLALLTAALRHGLPPDIRGLGYWALALGLISTASIIPALDPGPREDWRPLLSNLGYTPATSLLGYAILRFFERPLRPRYWVGLTLAVYFIGLILSLIGNASSWRIGLISVHLVVVAGLALNVLFHFPRTHWSLGGLVLSTAMLLMIFAPVYRVFSGWIDQAPITFLSGSNPAVGIYLALINVGLLLGTLGLILLSNERNQRTLQHLATHDSLTDLLTRRGFAQLAQPLLERARRAEEPMALAIVDIDHFKRVNDSFGHQTGDQVLREVANTLRTQLRGADLIGRFGGEEFVVLLPNTGADTALDVAERLRHQVQELQVCTSGGAVSVTASIGLAISERLQRPHPIEDLYREADRALYQAKDQGRNRVVPFKFKSGTD